MPSKIWKKNVSNSKIEILYVSKYYASIFSKKTLNRHNNKLEAQCFHRLFVRRFGWCQSLSTTKTFFRIYVLLYLLCLFLFLLFLRLDSCVQCKRARVLERAHCLPAKHGIHILLIILYSSACLPLPPFAVFHSASILFSSRTRAFFFFFFFFYSAQRWNENMHFCVNKHM